MLNKTSKSGVLTVVVQTKSDNKERNYNTLKIGSDLSDILYNDSLGYFL